MIEYDGVKMSWKNTIYPHAFLGAAERFKDHAKILCYDFYCWNARIYTVNGKDTGYLAQDLDTTE